MHLNFPSIPTVKEIRVETFSWENYRLIEKKSDVILVRIYNYIRFISSNRQ